MTEKLRKVGSILATVCGALTVSFVCAELLGANHFLRNVIQGRAFWYYLVVFLGVLGVIFLAFLKARPVHSLAWLLLVPILFGFASSLIAISLSPLLSIGSLSPTVNAWKEPAHLALAVVLSLGWLYAMFAGLAIHFLHRARYMHIAVLMAACIAIRLLGMLPIKNLVH